MGKKGHEILQTLARITTDTKQTATEFNNEVEQLPGSRRFGLCRLNAVNIHGIPLEEWEKFDKLAGFTNAYLNDHRQLIDDCANVLKTHCKQHEK